MGNSFDVNNDVKEPGIRECWKVVLAMALFFFAFCIGTVFVVRYQIGQEEIARAALAQKEQSGLVKISAAKAAKITKKRKTKMVKIALGTTKQADLVSTLCTIGAQIHGASAIQYGIRPRGGGAWVKLYDSGSPPSDWGVDGSDNVKASADIPPGEYESVYEVPYSCDPGGPDAPGSGTAQRICEFEVVCIEKVVITATKID
jgi:hypothetical protein